MDLPVNLDLHRVVFVQVGLSTLASASVAPAYNLPIHLYGLYNIEADLNQSPGASEGLRQYSILLVVSFGLDLIWMYNWSSTTSALPFILILIGLVIKPITLLTCLNQLNRSGNGFTGVGGIGSNYQYQYQQNSNQNPQGRQSNFDGNISSPVHHQTPVWAASQQSHQFKSHKLKSKPPGPSSVSHQALSSSTNPSLPSPNNNFNRNQPLQSSSPFSNNKGINPHNHHQDFVVDHNEEDAQNLSDDEVLNKAKKELDSRIAQKKRLQLQQQQQHQLIDSTSNQSNNLIGGSNNEPKTIDGSGYHTLE